MRPALWKRAYMSKPLIADIVKYFEDTLASGNVGSDDKESLEVAIDAIKEVFGVEAGSNDLEKVYQRGLSGTNGTGTNGADGVGINGSSGTTSGASENGASPKPITEEIKQEAEQKKVEGNREMAHKNYEKAIDLYTQAISINPENPLYYSNRAAAYSQANKPSLAVSDARRAISLDPKYSKAYSRLGVALYALGDSQGALHAYEQGIKAEGDAPSEGMLRGYDTVKSRIESESKELSAKDEGDEKAATSADAPATDSFSGVPNLGSLGGLGGLGELFNNPEIKNMASKMMSNPSMMANLMNSPAAKSIQNQFGGNGGGMPDLGKLMNDPNLSKMMNDPMIQNMAKQFMGGDK